MTVTPSDAQLAYDPWVMNALINLQGLLMLLVVSSICGVIAHVWQLVKDGKNEKVE